MNISLENREALVGGCTQGIGRAIAIQLAESGATVTLMARNEEKLKALCNTLPTPLGQQHRYLVADFSNLESYKQVVGDWLSNHRVDILVNNTQGPASGTVSTKELPDYQQAFELLFQVHCFTTNGVLAGMKERGYGRIINVSSISVREPLQHLVLSNTLRSALLTWTKTLATDVAQYNITANSILTGYFETERLRSLIETQSKVKNCTPAELQREMELQVPARRFGKPEEYGWLVAFLASPQAAYITGTAIPIDGGLLKSL